MIFYSNVRKTLLLILVLFCVLKGYSQSIQLNKIEPPNWWIGMQNPNLQLMIYGKNIGEADVYIDNQNVTLKAIHNADSPNYLFVDLEIKMNAEPGFFNIIFKKNGKLIAIYSYELKAREPNSALRESFNTSDVIYLITPDRFANGNPNNDIINGMYENVVDRKDHTGRHGGDIKGIINHLDYIKNMGFTAIWLNPVLENNMKRTTYHGYAITDFYKTDPRYGTNNDYKKLVTEAKNNGIKVIMDMIPNHCGAEHSWMYDLPFKDWINVVDTKERTNHRRTVHQDPYASNIDRENMSKGWFVEAMPDLNHNNEFMAKYLTQNAIWWIEFLGLGGIRIDTYPYADKNFSTKWTKNILQEFPNVNMVGEEWSYNPSIVAYWQKGKKNSDNYISNLPSLMDFPLQSAIYKGLTESEEIWAQGLTTLYEALANDFIYADPQNLVIFLDNHDMSRFYTQIGEDIDLLKMGAAYLFTTRGIPQIFYGTEILMSNKGTDEHGIIRSDFPGGWEDDKVNAFTGIGLTEEQKDVQLYFKKLLNWRKYNDIIHNGNLTHFAPQNGIYVLFRYNNEKTKAVMLIINKNYKTVSLDTKNYSEILNHFTKGKNVLMDEAIYDLNSISVNKRSALILELR